MQQDSHILNERKEIWKSKKILKRLYHNWYRMIGNALRPGSILEIGGGSGNLKEFFQMQSVPMSCLHHGLKRCWMHTTSPFTNATFDNIILFDVLHHLHDPSHFFSEAQRF